MASAVPVFDYIHNNRKFKDHYSRYDRGTMIDDVLLSLVVGGQGSYSQKVPMDIDT